MTTSYIPVDQRGADAVRAYNGRLLHETLEQLSQKRDEVAALCHDQAQLHAQITRLESELKSARDAEHERLRILLLGAGQSQVETNSESRVKDIRELSAELDTARFRFKRLENEICFCQRSEKRLTDKFNAMSDAIDETQSSAPLIQPSPICTN